jgi:4-hydroxymandelate oxidase
MPTSDTPLNLVEYETAARAKLPAMVFDYFAGGAADEVTLRAARAAWEERFLRYRVMADVSSRSLATTVLGQRLDFPVMVAPMAFQRLAHEDGEVATMRAAGRAGSGMILSTLATRSIEDVRGASDAPLWFQLYIYRDRGVSRELVERAERAGCSALVLTVDAPLLGRRERDVRNGFHVPAHYSIPNLTGAPRAALAGEAAGPGAGSSLAAFVEQYWDSSIAWPDLAWLRSITTLPILVKGVVRGDDARRALEHGAAGVIVSNHGGRQLDGSLPTARALPEVAAAMRGEGALLVDGGVRRGTDVLKAIAMGAQAVLLGRPVLWGLAVGGEDGVYDVLRLLRDECDLALALAGCRTPADLASDFIA